MAFAIINLIAFLTLITFIVASIKRPILFWPAAYVFSLLIVLQLVSLYLSRAFIDYKFIVHFNRRDLAALKHLYIPQAVFIIILFLFLPVALHWLKNKVLKFSMYTRKHYRYLVVIGLVAIMCFNMGILSNAYSVIKIMASNESSFKASLHNLNINNYVSASEVNAVKGKNIIVISLESFEKGYLSDAKDHLTPNMRSLARRWNYFDMSQTPGNGWTSGSLYAVLTGLPSYFKGDGNAVFQESYDSNIAGIGHVLEKVGYSSSFFIQDAEFAGTQDLLRVFKINNIIDKRNIGSIYGDAYKLARDFDLFEAAKLEVIKNKGKATPFALFISTLDTHNPNGIYDGRFEGEITPQETELEFMVAAVDYKIGEFVKFLEKENQLENTIIYIFPDHLKMGDASMFKGTGPRNLFLLSNAKAENLDLDNSEKIYQIDLPKIILAGAGIEHNVRFLTDYISGDKIDYIENNASLIASLNKSGLKRKKIWDGELTIELEPSNTAAIKFGNNSILISKDTLERFVSRLSFSKELRLVNKEYLFLQNNTLPPPSNEYVDVNFYLKNDTLNAYLQMGYKLPVLKADKNSVTFLKDEIESIAKLPSFLGSDEHTNKFIMWEDDELIEVSASPTRDYLDHWIDIPYSIKEGFIELEYSTIGDAKPYVIAFDQPYSPASIVLHDQIPNSEQHHSVRLSFNRSLKNPVLIFRNWSQKGRFIVNKFRIIGLGSDNDTRFTKKSENIDSYVKDIYRFIAHAGGSIDEKKYTNSLEALNHSYEQGFRLFELDIIKTSDGKFVAAHDWQHWAGLTHYRGSLPVTEQEFLKHRILDKYTPLNIDLINDWFDKHKDAVLVTDKVNEPIKFAREFTDKSRLMMELFTLGAVKEGLSIGIKSPILSENVLKDLGKDKVAALRRLGVKDIAISRRNIVHYVSFLKRLIQNDIHTYVYDVNFEDGKDENYVINFEIDYIYGLYADNWKFR
jgi:glycerophosphoryl diester phosphodiesterase